MTKWIVGGLGLFVSVMAAAATTGPELDVQTRFDQIERALNGEREAIEALATTDENDAFFHFVRGIALANMGQIDEASAALQQAVRLGDDMAILALADVMYGAGRYIDAFAWAQVWLQHDYTVAEIQQGKANSDPSMHMLRRLIDKLDETSIQQAENHAHQVLNEWLPQFEKQTTGCIQPAEVCPEWTAIRHRAPRFPGNMVDQRQPGWSRQALLVNEQGQVTDLLTLHSSQISFGRSAERAVRRWRFESSSEQPTPALFQTSVMFGFSDEWRELNPLGVRPQRLPF